MKQVFEGEQGHLAITAQSDSNWLSVTLRGQLYGSQEGDEVEEITLVTKLLTAAGDQYSGLIVDITGLSSVDAQGERALGGLLTLTTRAVKCLHSDLTARAALHLFALEQLAA